MEILFEEKNKTGIITLNRPRALNALNLDMAKLLSEKLSEWKENNNISRVLLQGEGSHFCAGGDVKSLVLSNNKKIKQEFFKEEYRLNYFISEFPKDYLSIWNGVVMGGGVGLSIYGNYRLVNETSRFAMPETIIGFFPDVGASYFLSNIPKNIGKYLGLTGHTLKANEMLYFKLATNYFDSKNLNKIRDQYIYNGEIENSYFKINENSEFLKNINQIEEYFEGDFFSILNKLENSNNEFANNILHILNKRCPMSLMVTCELINKAKDKSLKECLEMEFQLSQHLVYRDDFNNGVNAVLINKNHNQKWTPAAINEIKIENIYKLFEIHTETLNI